MDHWLYRRVLAFHVPHKPKQKGDGWLIDTSGETIFIGRLIGRDMPLPLSPHRDWGQCRSLLWLAWDDDFEYADLLDKVLSSLGEHGWELVAIQTVSGSQVSYYVFKRPFDHELAELIEERLADTDSRPTFTQEEVEEHIRQWRG